MTNTRVRQETVVINFVVDPVLPILPIGSIENMRADIDLGRLELSRTHWAVKGKPIFDVLLKKDYISQQQLDASQARKELPLPATDGALTFNA